jgi:hypothetical protein
MGRSKERGKPVADLTADELRREQVRLGAFLAVRRRPEAKKRAARGLREIDARLAAESLPTDPASAT